MSHPTKLLSVRGILLAKTHFDVLGFEGARLRPEDMTDAGVLAAYRLAAARCHPSEGCDALGAQTAFCRVGRAFAALRTAVGRHHAWREMCAGRGALASTMSPDPTVVPHPWTSEHALEHSRASLHTHLSLSPTGDTNVTGDLRINWAAVDIKAYDGMLL